jgi:cellulose synthase/poly-beta-1,6-N-acetylglucosamine synthase-like glycosyltransferase
MALAGGVPSVQSAAFAALLVDSGLITGDQLEIARAAKSKTGLRLDEILTNLGMVDADVLLRVMASAWKITPIDLSSAQIDHDLVRHWPGGLYLEQNWVPVRDQANGSVLVATARVPDEERAAAISSVLESPVEFVVATSWDIRSAVRRSFKAEIADEASAERWRTNPSLSARVVLSNGQTIGGIILGFALVVLAFLWPAPLGTVVLSITSIGFLGAATFILVMTCRGGKRGSLPTARSDESLVPVAGEPPIYTVLVPVFRQADAVPGMIANLALLDYPPDRLEVLILVEEEDHVTRDAIDRAGAPGHFRVVAVPRGAPETRPRACNVGLFVARGEFLVVYGADHVPAPDQLTKAVAAFGAGDNDLICVQASVRFSNADANGLTRMVALEHSSWVDRVLPGLARSRIAVPVGATSNHFRTADLIELGGWDPYNVSENADLGIRANAVGYRVAPLDSTTLERAPASAPTFIRQRSRWIKGYLQTAFVHARQPVALVRQIGIARFLGGVLLVGVPVMFLAVIPFYLLIVVAIVVPSDIIETILPMWALLGGIALFFLGTIAIIVASALGPIGRKAFAHVPFAFLTPLYWVLNSIAAYKALGQLFTRPHYWEKTDRESSRSRAPQA